MLVHTACMSKDACSFYSVGFLQLAESTLELKAAVPTSGTGSPGCVEKLLCVTSGNRMLGFVKTCLHCRFFLSSYKMQARSLPRH